MSVKPEYKERFLRHIGIMNEEGLSRFKKGSVAIAGLGVGARSYQFGANGFEKFHICRSGHTREPTSIVNGSQRRRRSAAGRTTRLLQEARSLIPTSK